MTSVPLPVTTIAAAGDHIFLASGSTIHAFNASTGSTTTVPYSSSSNQPHASALIRHIAISHDQAHLAAVFDDKSLRVYTTSPFQLLSTRQTSKKCSSLSWTSNDEILVSDKVGDTYRYPLVPRPRPEGKTTITATSTDPSKNPDADLVLGHVSIITAHLLTPDNKRIITSDRDEHIRISRYPDAFVIDKFLLGSNGFVSAIHAPSAHPDILISAGGENNMRIWDWKSGQQVSQVEIWEAVLPHRRARSSMRKLKKPRKETGTEQGFYSVPEGWMLPSGQGILVQKIDTVTIGEETVVLFHSQGAAALNSFVLSLDPLDSPSINTLPFSHPILDFVPLPNQLNRFLVSFDPAFGVIRDNHTVPPFKGPQTLSDEQMSGLSKSLAVVQVSQGGKLELVESDILAPLQEALNASTSLAPLKTAASLSLYFDLSLYPRWAGFEEDDELAGTAEDNVATGQSEEAADGSGANSETGAVPFNPNKKDWTREELEQLQPRQLGRLKALGVDVGNLLSRKKIKRDAEARRRARGDGVNGENDNENKRPKKAGAEEVVDQAASNVDDDNESAMNA